jgi:hypothetical protein
MHHSEPAGAAVAFARALVTLGADTPDMARNIKWAKAIARGIRKHYRFLTASQEERDLEGVALQTMWKCAGKFDPSRVPEGGSFDGAFRGWCHPFIKGDVQREARRLRNGGTYHTRRETGREQVMVEELPWRRDESGSAYVDLIDHRADGREEWERLEESPARAGGVEYVTDPDEEL